MRNLLPNYDKAFFDYLNTGSLRSAKVIIPILKEYLVSESVLDVGCGQGAWLSVWKKAGIIDVYGVDGDYVDAGNLLINNNEFMDFDLIFNDAIYINKSGKKERKCSFNVLKNSLKLSLFLGYSPPHQGCLFSPKALNKIKK